jgi:hemin uptake protein HemP
MESLSASRKGPELSPDLIYINQSTDLASISTIHSRIVALGLAIANANHYYRQMSDQRREEPLTAVPAKATDPLPRVSSRQLLGAHGELIIEHQGREYRLRITQNGKLILTA